MLSVAYLFSLSFLSVFPIVVCLCFPLIVLRIVLFIILFYYCDLVLLLFPIVCCVAYCSLTHTLSIYYSILLLRFDISSSIVFLRRKE